MIKNISLNHVRLRDKMLILYFTSVFIPIVLTHVIFYNVTTNNVKEQRMGDISRAVEQMKNEFRNEVENAVSVSMVFYTDLMLNDILEADYDNPADYVRAYDSYLRRILNSYGPIYYSMQSITVYIDNPSMLYSGGVAFISDEIKQTEWYRQLKEEKGSEQPIFIRQTENGSVTYSIVRVLDFYYSQNKREKIIKIDLQTDELEQIFANLNLQGDMYLIDESGHIQYSTNPEIDWLNERTRYDTIALKPDTVEFTAEAFTSSYLNGWQVIGTISEDEVFREVQNSRTFIIYMACVNILIPTLIILWITRNLNVRLVRILKHMKKVKNQQFDTIPQAETRDEIGQLTGEFNRMTLQIKSLIDDVYVADIQRKNLEIQRRNSQLHALQSQINPHFLFNALETIRMRSLMKNETETAKIIHNMAKLFRSSLTWNKDRITVAEEVEFITCFLEIQQYRFGDRLKYELEVEESAKNCMIPKMLFLPFVENASIHGIEPLKSGGTIVVRIAKEGEYLRFTILDNGIGMKEEKARQIRRYLEEDDELGDRIGMQNVIYRLKMVYGDSFRFDLHSAPERGTKIDISVPSAM